MEDHWDIQRKVNLTEEGKIEFSVRREREVSTPTILAARLSLRDRSHNRSFASFLSNSEGTCSMKVNLGIGNGNGNGNGN